MISNDKVGYNYERFDDIGYTNMALKGKKVYLEEEQRYREMTDVIHDSWNSSV